MTEHQDRIFEVDEQLELKILSNCCEALSLNGFCADCGEAFIPYEPEEFYDD